MGMKLAVCWLLKICLSVVGVLRVAEAALGLASAPAGGGEVRGTDLEYKPEPSTTAALIFQSQEFRFAWRAGLCQAEDEPRSALVFFGMLEGGLPAEEAAEGRVSALTPGELGELGGKSQRGERRKGWWGPQLPPSVGHNGWF